MIWRRAERAIYRYGLNVTTVYQGTFVVVRFPLMVWWFAGRERYDIDFGSTTIVRGIWLCVGHLTYTRLWNGSWYVGFNWNWRPIWRLCR